MVGRLVFIYERQTSHHARHAASALARGHMADAAKKHEDADHRDDQRNGDQKPAQRRHKRQHHKSPGTRRIVKILQKECVKVGMDAGILGDCG